MQAVYYDRFRKRPEIRDLPIPAPGAGGVVIKVEATGLCRSDWHGWMGHDADIELPHVPGHEFAGVILETGNSVRNFSTGDRVTVPFAMGCGSCATCHEGNTHICDRYYQPGFTGWGSFAEYVAVPYADVNLVKLPEGISMDTAASLGCRFTTAYRAVVFQGNVTKNQWVAIHGLGGVGLSAVMIAKSRGARVIGVDIRKHALERARNIGADFVIDASDSSSVSGAIKELSTGGVHLSIDALGSVKTFSDSIASLRKRARHIQIGLLLADDSNPPVDMSGVIAKELEILGSHGMPSTDYRPMLDSILRGDLDPESLIGNRIPLTAAPNALVEMNRFENDGITLIIP